MAINGNALLANDTILGIANAIRAKDGTASLMKVGEMAGRVAAIPNPTTQAEKNAVKAAINAKNATVAPTDEVSQWPTSIASIPSGSAGIENLTIASLLNDPENLNNIKSIGINAFAQVNGISVVSLPVCTSIGSTAFGGRSSLTTVSLPSATSIGGSAFMNCSSLATLSIPSVTSIGTYAFRECSSITTLSLPVCTSIGSYAFEKCSSLATLSIPAVTSIGSYVFMDCYSLTTLSIPECTSIGGGAFYESALSSLNLSSLTVAQVEDHAYDWDIPSGCVVQCKDGTYTQE